MANLIQIWNMAFGHIGHDRTVIAENETSKEARLCSLYWDDVRKAVLEEAPWSFATRNINLSLLDGEPSNNAWDHVYAMPADCLAPRYLTKPGYGRETKAIAFEIGVGSDGKSHVIHTDEAMAGLCYTHDLKAVGLFPPKFVELVAKKLAIALAPSITNDLRKKQVAEENYRIALEDARALYANQGEERDEPDGELITGRI